MTDHAEAGDDGLLLRTLEALGKGDFSVRMPANLPGRSGKIAALLNAIIEKQGRIASEVADVARIVGEEGQLAHRASLPGASGGWASTIRCVNELIDDLVRPTREMSRVIDAVARGDMSEKITVDARGEVLQLKNTINTMVVQLRSFASEVTRVAREVGTEGKLGGQASVPGAGGTWKDLTDNVNLMASNLTGQVRNIAEVTTAVANGDLSKKITVDVKGEIAELKNTINVMVDQLNSFASEVTRVAREVGTEGKLGGQANVRGVGGIWKDLTDNVNFMASNLTGQVRNIAAVTTAVARGDLSKKITVDVKGEIRELKDTINVMVDQLSSFASEVTRVAREVGTDGKLGGQARVEGVAGTWRDLTENVNQLAANLTSQVRAIADVATAVTRGDLSQSIRVDARGEVSMLKDSINEMIRNLKETTQKNAEQDWLKGNLARITRLLQGQRDMKAVTSLILSELAPLVSAHHGAFYLSDPEGIENGLRMVASYGYRPRRDLPTTFLPGEGLVGQCAIEKQRIWLTNVPPDYIQVSSGLGSAPPANIVVLPILFGTQAKAVLEIASLDRFTPTHMSFLDQLMESIGVVLNTIEANGRTESLLTQSQSLAQELQQTNMELADKASLLSRQNIEVERKNREVEQAKLALEEKATQLALSSKYKSEFLANMSHELRTPLNSLLILAQQLSENLDGNLTREQIEFARTIHGSGSDLLTLINDILDLSKVESGTVSLEVGEYRFTHLRSYVERTFRHMAEARGLDFRIDLDDNLPASLMIDMTRLQQILKNLLSNAFKFTESGDVSLHISMAARGWTPDHPSLSAADGVIAFAVADTGIGIANEKLRLIFEAFQQADGSTARRYGGTGLGLSISRELARLLNGEIQVQSAVGEGSVFTLYLPFNEADFAHAAGTGELSDALPGYVSLRSEPRSLAHEPELPANRTSAPVPVPQIMAAPPAPLPAANDDEASQQLAGRKVLIVDDDLRNIFALSSVLERRQMQVVFAENGRDGIALLEADPGIELVLMDVMMPGMDGYDTTRAIRAIERFADLPIITVTAKAMKGDREKGIAAGSSDYITKPVDVSQLLAMIKRWLPQNAKTRT